MLTVQERAATRLVAPRPGHRVAVSGWGVPHLVAVALVLGAAVFCLAPPSDPDVWWHLRAGDLIRDTHALPDADPWSLGAAGREWVAHSWLAEVLLSLLHSALGLKGLVLFRAVAVGALLAALAVQAFRRTTPARALLVLALAVLATKGGWGERPQLLSFLLLIPTAQLVRSAVAGARSVWWVVPITYLWANLHGLWFLAPVLVALGALGAWTAEPAAAGVRVRALRARPFVLAAAAAAAAAALTPNGPVLLAQPFRVNGYAQFVSEWGPVDVHSVWGIGFFGMVLAFVWAYGKGSRPLGAYELTSVSFAIGLGLLYTRTVAPAAVLLVPLLAEALGRMPAPRRSGTFPPAFSAIALGTLLLLGTAGATVVLTQQPDLPPAAPVAATDALVDAVDGTPRVLNEYALGGWLLHFAPGARPAIDGRAEIYPVDFVADYLHAIRMVGDWEHTVEQLRPNSALLHPDTPLVNGLRDQLGWQVAYEDADWVVLVPPDATRP